MRYTLWIAATCFIAAVVLNVRAASLPSRRLQPASAQAAQNASAGQASDAVAANQATVQKYCVSCHNDKVKSGGLALTHVGFGARREERRSLGTRDSQGSDRSDAARGPAPAR